MISELVLFESEQKLSRLHAASFLRELADKLESGTVTVKQGENEVTLTLPKTVTLELKAEEKAKQSGVKRSFEVEFEWLEGDAVADEAVVLV